MKIPVAVLGATGLIGQQFCRMLADHPQFEVAQVLGSQRSAEDKLGRRWNLPGATCPASLSDMTLMAYAGQDLPVKAVFSALPSSVAAVIEAELREKGLAVFSNASAFRMKDTVPILIPEINADQLSVITNQKEESGTDGFIITNSNCSVSGAALYLHEMRQIANLDEVIVTTYQAMSGAGNRGIYALDMYGNVKPYIKDEEAKIAAEGRKILGKAVEGKIEPADLRIMANCARVPVVDGHMEAISIKLKHEIDRKTIVRKLASVQSPLVDLKLPTAPLTHLQYLPTEDRPQTNLDVMAGEPRRASGMTASVGRVRVEGPWVHAYVLVHNTIRGGAGGSVINAELALAKGML